jgi:osmotically-inducible protein OsmY
MRRRTLLTTVVCGLTVGLGLAISVHAQQAMPASSKEITTSSKSVENDRVLSSAEHHYNSPAERANDDLIITEVKTSLADKKISDGYPVAVDCDHGTVQLTGVVATADNAKQATLLAQNIQGVVAVKNQLTWRY